MTQIFNKKKSKLRKALLIILVSVSIFSCDDDTKNEKQEKTYPVEIEILKNKEKVRQIEYFGIISSQIINYSFLTAGRVKTIFVRKNQYVTKGTKLMQLETTGFNLALNAAKNQEIQAKSAFLEADKYYNNLEKAFKSGGISESDLEKAKLDRDVKLKDKEQSKINIQSKNEDFKQTTLYAQTNGIVSDIIPRVGELIDAGAETIIIQGKGMFAETALSQKDLEFIKTSTKAIVEIRNKKIEGHVTYISALPDFQTFRHTVKIDFSGTKNISNITIGQTTKIYFETDTVKGIWIPMKYISNNGQDFINVVENNRLRKKKIQIIDFSGDKVRILGLKENEKLITKGASRIKEGYRVEIKNEKD